MALGRFRTLSQPPRTHGEVVEDRSVSFLELFYDLVYVVLIARLAATLAHTAFLAMALLMRQLADYKRFIDVYEPVVRLAVVITVAALGVAALQPRPIGFVIVSFFMMTTQWIVAVYQWTATEEGIAHVAGDHA